MLPLCCCSAMPATGDTWVAQSVFSAVPPETEPPENAGTWMTADHTFEVTLTESNEQKAIGLDFDTSDPEVCVIVRIDPFGQAAVWNETEGRKLRVHDRLVAVDGQTLKATELVQQVQTLDSCTLMIERPETWEQILKKRGRLSQYMRIVNNCNIFLKYLVYNMNIAGLLIHYLHNLLECSLLSLQQRSKREIIATTCKNFADPSVCSFSTLTVFHVISFPFAMLSCAFAARKPFNLPTSAMTMKLWVWPLSQARIRQLWSLVG